MAKSAFEVEHVLMTADAVGGVWNYCLDLSRELSRHDVRVSLATMGPPPSAAQVREAQSIFGLDLYLGNFKLEWMQDSWQEVDAASEWLLELAGRLRPDIVHLNGYCHAHLPFRVPTLTVAHSDVLTWWRAVKGESAPAEWAEYRRRVHRGLESADLIVAPTAAMLHALQYEYGEMQGGRVIYNGRSGGVIASQGSKKEPVILSAGRLWDDAKNVGSLLAAAPSVDWPIFVAGDADRTLEGPLQFLGKLTADVLSGWMDRASIYCLPARYEPFGLSILEAAMHGCALVLGNIPSLRELWDEAALFVDPNDPAQLAETLNYLATHDEQRHKLSLAALKRSELFSVRTMGCGYLFAYQELKQGSEWLEVASHAGVSLL